MLQIVLCIDVLISSLLVIVFLTIGAALVIPSVQEKMLEDYPEISEYYTQALVFLFGFVVIYVLNLCFICCVIKGGSTKKRNCLVPFMTFKVFIIIIDIYLLSMINDAIRYFFLKFIFEIFCFLLMLKVWFDQKK